MIKLNFVDRLVLYRHIITKIVFISKTLKVYHTNSKELPVILKFSYPGNVQYHKITQLDLEKLIPELSSAAELDKSIESG